MQLEPLPRSADLSAGYSAAASEDYLEEEAGQRATAREVLARLELHAPPGELLDLGCWVGFLLDEGRRRGWDPIGVEPSRFAASYAREELGLEIVEAELLDAELGERSFDAIFMGDVIEHLPDPGAALDRVAELLAPGGLLALAAPDAGSRLARTMGRRWWSVIPTHVHYFTRRSLSTLLERHGFEVIEIETQPKCFSVRYYLSRIAGYSPAISRLAVRAAEALRLANRLWAPDFRDRMMFISRLSRSQEHKP